MQLDGDGVAPTPPASSIVTVARFGVKQSVALTAATFVCPCRSGMRIGRHTYPTLARPRL